MGIIRTNLAMVAYCKCGGVIAATSLYGGVSIDGEFMNTVAETANDGGEIKIVNTKETPVSLTGCKCELENN